jgi:hypothetical protein
MRIVPVRVALAAGLLSALSLAAAPAQAGGPTSAFLSIPGAGSTASLYYTDPEYDELSGLVGMSEPTMTFAGKASGSGHASGPGVTITWLIHDVEPWRVDRVYLGAKDGPWIATQITEGNGSLWESPVLWHQPADGKGLVNLLQSLGLGTDAAGNTSFQGVPGAALPESEDTTTAPPTAETRPPAEAAGPEWYAGAGWGLAGLLGGALLMFAWTRRRGTVGADEADLPPGVAEGYVDVLVR